MELVRGSARSLVRASRRRRAVAARSPTGQEQSITRARCWLAFVARLARARRRLDMCLRTLSREGGAELPLLFNLSLFFPLGGPLCHDKLATRRRASGDGAMPPLRTRQTMGWPRWARSICARRPLLLSLPLLLLMMMHVRCCQVTTTHVRIRSASLEGFIMVTPYTLYGAPASAAYLKQMVIGREAVRCDLHMSYTEIVVR